MKKIFCAIAFWWAKNEIIIYIQDQTENAHYPGDKKKGQIVLSAAQEKKKDVMSHCYQLSIENLFLCNLKTSGFYMKFSMKSSIGVFHQNLMSSSSCLYFWIGKVLNSQQRIVCQVESLINANNS